MKIQEIKKSLTRGLTRNVYLLGLLSFFNDFTSEMISPLLPIYLAGMGLGAAFLGVMEGLANFLCYLTMLISGIFADRYRKNEAMTFWGYRVCAWIRLLFAIPHPIPVLSGRLIDRIGKGVRTAPRDRLITAYVEKKYWGKGFGLQRAFDHGGSIMGAIAAALFLTFYPHRSLSYLFLFASIPAILSITLISRKITDRVTFPKSDVTPISWGRLPREIRPYVLVIFLSAFSSPSELFLMLKMVDLGMAKYQVPVLWIVMTIFKMISAFLGGILADRWSRRKTIGLGWLIFSISFVGFALNTQIFFAWGLIALYGFHSGLLEASERAYPATLAKEEERATVLGWYYFAFGIGSLPASLLFGWAYSHWGSETAFLVYAGLALLTIPLLLLLPTDRPS